MGAEVLIALQVARELALIYFRLLETAGLTDEEKRLHYEAMQVEFYGVDTDDIPNPEDLK